MSDPSRNRERGLRAALNNPRVSEEAKAHDRELLATEFGEQISEEPQPAVRSGRRASTSKKGSHAAASHSEQASPSGEKPEAPPKATGRQTRRASGGDVGLQGHSRGEEKDKHNVIRGLKAALKNPNVSEKAKEADRQKLRELGETVE